MGKGYAFVQYEDFSAAREARSKADGEDFMGQNLLVDWAIISGMSTAKMVDQSKDLKDVDALSSRFAKMRRFLRPTAAQEKHATAEDDECT
eukprot:scaffold503_cov375-Pinguiococcus_pyrenoidosus.AAC.24